MSQVEQFSTLFSYHFDTTERLMDQAGKLPDEQYRDDLGIKWGSVHELLLHILATDNGYRVALETGRRPAPLKAEKYPDLDALRGLLAEERAGMSTYLEALSDGMIEEAVELRAGPDRSIALPRWRFLNHMLFHGMQHQADIAARLTKFGHSPGDLDFIFYT
jgi:uncharacterized damage-inducible protein DinB